MSTSLSNRVSVGSAGWLLKEAKGAQFELNLVGYCHCISQLMVAVSLP
jgi:hypothetical protein